ncbi:MAG: hydrogenase maturation protease [Verrucomicrobia bacterium]|nr:hydrogenase maturation protease [Verrucomicrobiota bacterium]
MPDLREQLEHCFQGRVCLMGLGNVDYGDDGLGVRLAERLKAEGRGPKAEGRSKSEGRNTAVADSDFDLRPSFGLRPSAFGLEVVVAGTSPERHLTRIADSGYDHVIFLDAVEFGGTPGSAVFLDSEEMAARFPQVSTHKISLGVLAKWVEENGTTKAWLLGVQPESLKPARQLTPTVRATVEALKELLESLSLAEVNT